IVDAVCALLSSTQDVAPRDYTGKTVLITAGPTREPLDPVRYLSNRSSGKMGYALAEAALARGAQVTLVSGPVSLAPIPGVEMIPVQTTQDLYQTLMTQSIKFHIVIQAAAPADYRAETVSPQKIKKQGDAPLVLRLVQNPDVAAAVGAQKQPGQILVGFAAETENVLSHAEQKLEKKNLDMIIVNDVTLPGAGFDVDTNIATFITRNASQSFPLQTKRHLADAILDAILQLEK
ncbi:MAG: bifunctional phosphopantothenoylcysteine decarboxylase/phosphopantothenate--cysteine ligase CoaBC, partial [Clostridia bacterium]